LRTPGVGCKTFLKILNSSSPRQIFFDNHQALSKLNLHAQSVAYIKKPDWQAIDNDLEWLTISGNLVITIQDNNYPATLKEISDPPPLLFIRGDLELLATPQIAIVGSRNPSRLGNQTAEGFAKTLADFGFTITSGLALGIDAASHVGALKATGKTIAVAGTGLDRVYPARHKQLATEITQTGTIISEFPPGTAAKASNFPRRNRIISGLALGLLVVEAAQKSGSLITARMALEQGREVFAIPGSIHNPLARGCNGLIREGAKLVETTQDIIEELGQYFQQPEINNEITQQTKLDLEQQNLLNLVMFSPTSIDDLVTETGKSIEILASMLLVLELQGYISSATGGNYIRII
jgi:DNA processing protein